MNVLVYSGPNVVQASLQHALTTLESLLSASYAVQTISQQSFTTHPWQSTCKLLVFPQCRDLSELTSVISTAKTYVENGGILLSLDSDSNSSSSTVNTGVIWDSFTGTGKIHRFHLFDETTLSYHARIPSCADAQMFGVQAFLRSEESTGVSKILAVRWDVGTGKSLMWGPRLSTPAAWHSDMPNGTKFQAVVRASLQDLGLDIPTQDASTVARPLPIFLVSSPDKPSVVHKILDTYRPVIGSEPSVHRDENDHFTFRAYSESAEILQAGCEISGACSEATAEPIHIIVCAGGELPSAEHTPQFDFHIFYQALSRERSKVGLPETPHPSGMGEVLLYGAVVKSTQTILHKNPRLISALPTPLLFIASRQLSARGRGTNVWISFPGCLQFSLLLRLSLSTVPASKLVFIQYLFGLAVTEACRDDAVLGVWGNSVRLKWPNDVYAVFGDEREKVGGILVNMTFRGDEVDIVIGCGLNLSASPTIPSLSQLLPYLDRLPMERTIAVIVAKFEEMWSEFVLHRGSFDPFMDLYLARWLHSDQLVTLTTTVPPTSVRIMGITSDHGLLRTIEERGGWSTRHEGFIDLQPDGNSFDLMAGLIKTKT